MIAHVAAVTQQSWTRKEICRVLSVPERQLRTWERQGLIEANETYQFHDMLALRTLNTLRDKHIPVRRIRQSLLSLRDRLLRLNKNIADVKVFTDGKRIGVQFSGEKMEPVSGQLLLDFERRNEKPQLLKPRVNHGKNLEQADFWFQKALELEQTGGPIEEAEAAYLKAIELNPESAGALVNLGTIYFHARDWKSSEKYYKAAVEADPTYPLAHYNLGNLYDERNDQERAFFHYRAALRYQPQYADAHYNLALLHQAQGDVMNALSHWKSYLRLDPASQWAQIARREIEKIKQTTVVMGARA